MTPIESGDPRLTAYVLGELTPGEAMAVETWLLKSPETRAEVQGIRNMIALLRVGFASELETSATAAPAFSIVRPSAEDLAAAAESRRRRQSWVVGSGLAAAAAIVVAFTSPQWIGSKQPTGAATTVASASLPPFSGSIPGAFGSAEGILLASATGEMLRAKPLGSDPVITEVRFLTDDSTELRNFPLTPEMVSYLPAPRAGGAAPAAPAGQPVYLDAERYPDPQIAPAREWNEWEDVRLMSALSASIAIGQDASPTEGKAGRLLGAGRQLFLAGEYESATAVFEEALRELPESVAGADPLREKIEALINASRHMLNTGAEP